MNTNTVFTVEQANEMYANFIETTDDRYKAFDVIIPNEYESIADSAFYYFPVSSLSFPSSLKEIGSSSFAECCIRELDIPSSVKKICDFAFSENFSLKKLCLHEGLEEIGSQAFFMCQDIENLPVVIPSTVTKIGDGAFSGIDTYAYDGYVPVVFAGHPEIKISSDVYDWYYENGKVYVNHRYNGEFEEYNQFDMVDIDETEQKYD